MQPPSRRLKDLVELIVAECPGDILTRTKLVKLVYLSDRRAARATGGQITDVSYVKYAYGPYSDVIVNATLEMDGTRIRVISDKGDEGRFYHHEPTDSDYDSNLCDEEREVVSDVIGEYGHLDTGDLVDNVLAADEVEGCRKYGTIRLPSSEET